MFIKIKSSFQYVHKHGRALSKHVIEFPAQSYKILQLTIELFHDTS
jgi:hypothetical protein